MGERRELERREMEMQCDEDKWDTSGAPAMGLVWLFSSEVCCFWIVHQKEMNQEK
jgi:hypothetical protein